MKRCMPIIILCMAILSACATPRKACRKADRLIARAVWKCPDVLQRDSATITIPARRDTVAAQPPSPDLDSLLAACQALNAALAAARLHATEDAGIRSAIRPAAFTTIPQAVQRVQQVACDWEGFTERVGRALITVKNVNGTPVLVVDDPGEVLKVPCPPVVNKTVVHGVAQWYRTVFWMFIGVVVVAVAITAASHHAGP